VSTYAPKAGDTTRSWYVIDAQDVVLGRLAVEAAKLLRGKHKPTFTPNVDGGDFVIVINAGKVRFTGEKWEDKEYKQYSGYPGGQKITKAKVVLSKKPYAIIETAVKGMLPKTKLGNAMYKKLFVYESSEHPHQAQQPEPFKF